MTALPLLATLLLAVEPTFGDPPPAAPALEPARSRDAEGLLAAGVTWLRYDDIPVSAVVLRAGGVILNTQTAPRQTRLGIGGALEFTAGQTEAGLRTYGLVTGPQFLLVRGRLRGGGGIQAGAYSIRRITEDFAELMIVGMLRGTLEADLWRWDGGALCASLTGTLGFASDLPLTGVALLVGARL